MPSLWRDARFAFRMFLRNPSFSLIAILSLSLGIGANTAIFSVFEKLQLEQLPYQDPGRLVLISEIAPKQKDGFGVCVGSFLVFRDQNRVFESIGADQFYWQANLTGGDGAQPLVGQRVTQGVLTTLGIQPALGRWFLSDDFTETALPAVIISNRLWQSRFHSDPQIVGKKLSLDNTPHVIVGVMPPVFRPPAFFYFNDEADFLKAFRFLPEQVTSATRYLGVVARLKPGVSLDQARANIDTIGAQLARAFPDRSKGWTVQVRPMQEVVTRGMRQQMYVMLGVVGFVLLIACANVAGLLLAQAQGRYREIAVRVAIGAGRARVIRQMLVESALLGLAGGAGGVVLAWWGVRAIAKASPRWMPRIAEAGVNPAVLLYALLISVGTALLFGLAPALQASRPDLNDSLKEAGRGRTVGSQRQRARGVMVLVEIAMAMVLLSGAGLLINSFIRLQAVEAGFRMERLVVFDLNVPEADRNYTETTGNAGGFHMVRVKPRLAALFNDVLEGLGRIPGVESAAAVSSAPLWGNDELGIQIEGRPAPADPEQAPRAGYVRASSGVFRTLDVAVLRGRDIAETDTASSPWVAVINQTMAKRYWSGEEALGKRFTISMVDGGRVREVVGVVADFRQNLERDPAPQAYVPYTQVPETQRAGRAPRWMSYVLRTSNASASLLPAIKQVVRQADPNQPVNEVRTMTGIRELWMAGPRLFMQLMVVFAAIAMVLAAIGIYGMIAFSVSSRTHEIGIRMALGAHRGSVLGLVIRRGLFLALGGSVLGLAGSLLLTRLLSSVLYGVQPHDPFTLIAVVLALNAIAIAACYIPARRATRIDPVEALRYE
jgi:putative ABC transport system permease protein